MYRLVLTQKRHAAIKLIRHNVHPSFLGISRRTEIIIAVNIVAPPGGKRNSRPASAEHGKGQDEQRRQTGTVKSTGHKVRVVLEDARSVVSEVELDEKSRKDLAEDDASLRLVVWDVSGVLDELGHANLCEREALDFGYKLEVFGQQAIQ